jgi:hypothetical protein
MLSRYVILEARKCPLSEQRKRTKNELKWAKRAPLKHASFLLKIARKVLRLSFFLSKRTLAIGFSITSLQSGGHDKRLADRNHTS